MVCFPWGNGQIEMVSLMTFLFPFYRLGAKDRYLWDFFWVVVVRYFSLFVFVVCLIFSISPLTNPSYTIHCSI